MKKFLREAGVEDDWVPWAMTFAFFVAMRVFG